MNEFSMKHQPPEVVDVVKLIRIICLKGDGKEEPVMKVERYYDTEGSFLFERAL